MNLENRVQPNHVNGRVTWQAPSNIAIVKYWGKTGVQEPINPSISFSLTNSFTTTTVSYNPKISNNDIDVEFYFEGKVNSEFEQRVVTYLKSIKDKLPFLTQYKLVIESENSFPHSSGIASSASSMAALALCLMTIEKEINELETIDFKEASNLARMGSGSGCRSVTGSWNLWGKTAQVESSSNQNAIAISEIAPVFHTLCDTILIIDPEKKKTSSTAGHSLMENHPFKEGRIAQANKNTQDLLIALKSGDMDRFIQITENEALTLHGLMLSSNPSYTLLLPNTLIAINKIRDFRKQTNLPICFTIDAGPNIHLIYPEEISAELSSFIRLELQPLCVDERVIFDKIGNGASQIES